MRNNSKSNKTVVVIGSLFIIIGIICNKWTLTSLFSPDGIISSPIHRIIIWSFNIVCILLGLLLLIFKTKIFSKNLLLTFSSIIICLLISEIFLRFFTAPLHYIKPGFFHYTYDPDVGIWMDDPHNSRPYINSFGMYDSHRQLQKQPGQLRIAMLGDSFVNGAHVGLGYRMSDLIDGSLGDKAEVLNFGIFSVGTVQELFIYKSKVRQFEPDIVILGFLPCNDINNNNMKIQLSSEYAFLKCAPYCIKTNGGDFQYRLPEEKFSTQTKAFFLPSPILLQRFIKLLDQISQTVQEDKRPLWGRPWPAKYVSFGVYGPPVHEEWEKAWDITEHTLLVLKDEVERDGAEFLLVILTNTVQIVPNTEEHILKLTGIVPPEDFDVDYPTNRLVEFAASHDIKCINLLPVFRKFAKGHNLQEPYFSFKNDGHWSRLGHSVAAEAISKYLIEIINH